MNLLLSKAGYHLNSTTNVWSRPDYSGIFYSDGDEVEQRIAAIINQATDLTVLSTELRQYCTDWAFLYHLSGTRANILRPFQESLKGASVLEIGAGCGAITRFLGECGAHVLALEGTTRRASIAQSRTRDMGNVTVLSESFAQLQIEKKFDFITLVGVLEYANLFVPGEHPTLAMLQSVKELLNPGGKLIIAIENQLGLKYFAGTPEDHIGKIMYGIEGRYTKGQPCTYGRKVLDGILCQAGFSSTEFLAPFPDYKLPVSIVTESGFANKRFDAAALASQSVRRDPQLPYLLTFAPELAWPGVVENGIAVDMANSFLIVASGEKSGQDESTILAYHYSTERISKYCKKTIFSEASDDSVEISINLLTPRSIDIKEERLIKFNPFQSSEYIIGTPLSMELVDIVTRDGWHIEEVGSFINRYLNTVTGLLQKNGCEGVVAETIDTHLPGECFDLVPQNIVVDSVGVSHLIDKEWTLVDGMSVGWLIYRSLLLLVYTVTRFGLPDGVPPRSRLDFFSSAFKAAGFDIIEAEIKAYAKMELAVQEEVTAFSSNTDLERLFDSPICFTNVNQALAESNGHIANLNQNLKEADIQFNAITTSLSWKITAPLRWLKSLVS